MRYTIEGYSQERLIDLGLDTRDAVILRWITDFLASGGMKKIVYENEEYFWIHYKSVMDDLPIAGVSSVRSMSRIFTKYIECGLMHKHVSRQVDGGTTTYFRFDQNMLGTLYSSPTDKSVSSDRTDLSHRNGQICRIGEDKVVRSREDKVVRSNPNTIDHNTSKSSSDDLLQFSDENDASPKKSTKTQELHDIFRELVAEWNTLTGQHQVYKISTAGMFCGKVRSYGLDPVLKAVRNYANSEWHRERSAFIWMRLWGKQDIIGEWVNRDEPNKGLSEMDRKLKKFMGED